MPNRRSARATRPWLPETSTLRERRLALARRWPLLVVALVLSGCADAPEESDLLPLGGGDSSVAGEGGTSGSDSPQGGAGGMDAAADASIAGSDAGGPGVPQGRDAAADADSHTDERDTRWDEPYSGKYTDDAKWLCRPGLPNNPCAADISITELLADGKTSISSLPATPPEVGVDCFYVYPTVDVGLFAPPRNLDFPEIDKLAVLDVMTSQVLPFRPLCNVYAPVYRQASLVSFSEDETRESGLEYGYDDVADAFDYYLRDAAADRPLVLIAHSQGSMVTMRLIKRHIQDDPQLRKRLVVAVLAGPLGGFIVPQGELVGGTLERIPLCDAARQTGCALTYNSFVDSNPPNDQYAVIGGGGVPTGHDTGCTNPATYDAAVTRLSGALFPARYRQMGLTIAFDWGGVEVATDYARYGDFFTGQCKTSSTGLSYLEIAVAPLADDMRVNPVAFDGLALADPSLGLHALDYAFIAGELFDAVETKIEAHPRP